MNRILKKISERFEMIAGYAEGKRYLIAGLISTGITWTLLIILIEILNINYLISSNAATFITILCTYFLNKIFVFQKYDKSHIKYGTKYVVMHLLLWIFGNVFLYSGVDILGLHYFPVYVTLVIILVALKYILMKFIVFK